MTTTALTTIRTAGVYPGGDSHRDAPQSITATHRLNALSQRIDADVASARTQQHDSTRRVKSLSPS